MLTWILYNTVIAGALALAVLAVSSTLRTRPATRHLLWVLVLICLLAPPLPLPTWPGGEIRTTLDSAWSGIQRWAPTSEHLAFLGAEIGHSRVAGDPTPPTAPPAGSGPGASKARPLPSHPAHPLLPGGGATGTGSALGSATPRR